MKKKLLTLLPLMAILTSCQDFLNLKPAYQISDQSFYQNQNDFEAALIGLYSTSRGLYNSSIIHYLTELPTDNAEIQWAGPTADEMQMDQNAVIATNAFILSLWNTCFYTISQSSNLLNRIDAVAFDQTAKNRIKGEALFLRALSYFYLVRLFGDVPIVNQTFTSPAEVSASGLARKPKNDVYKQIVDDLSNAESLLSITLNADKTHPSQMTVKALLGKVYLTQQNYDLAATKLKEVIDSKQYSLVPDYKSLSTNGNTNLTETLLEIDYLSGQSLGNNYSSLFTPANNSMAIFPNNQQGAGRIVPTLDMLNAYEAGDVRKAISVADSVLLITGKKTYNRYGQKFVDFKATDLADGSVAFTILRYADVLLMYGEALNELGKTVDALPALNQVRQRAKLPALSGLSQADIRLAFERERRVEFLYEGHRWFDLVRTGRAKTVLNAHYASQKLSFTVEDFELLFPVPQTEIDQNPFMKQNPGY
ncbi:RagB/SusD family nutrient uptake outer membrane protein [Spirosoma sp. HMF3257]|uniref:RagB/SusD family nutrient uptake outer membrane protein n=1 Tax=Spirosoma telluris TaxID=2183553 RepID=A0A327NG82_9BACT|nr:RagB/SusD family nutrient uptake outer membrane protein [Spirosoma telluris]RAI73034.1 RagB/SusD family nutrient uptake outer membrane protein [Spirosoma telluris]